MVSKATAKFIKSLQLKKFRQQHQAFLVEGAKSVLELLYARFPVKIIVATTQFISENTKILHGHDVYEAKFSELHALGTFKTNNTALAVADIILPQEAHWQSVNYALMLDTINDPGNLGTIIRIADWYGISHIIASEQTAELYNPKVIRASKGSFLRVNIYYRNLADFLKKNPKPLVGTFMEGESVHQFKWPEQGYVIMGNEANGISAAMEGLVDQRITIPGGGGTESLNVAIATAVVCDNWWRGNPGSFRTKLI